MEIAHAFPFDPTYGYDLDRLLTVGRPPEPAGFEAFWRSAHERTLAVPPRPTVRHVAHPATAFDAFEIEYDGLDAFRIGGWLTVPRGRRPRRLVVVGHGYCGRDGPDETWGLASDNVCLFPCARGFNRSANKGLPATAAFHVLQGIESKETYLHGRCASDLWSSVSAGIELFPELAGDVAYYGESFGGGIGAMALPWDARIKRACLIVPSFGNHPLRVQLPCAGSGEAVRLYRLRELHHRRPDPLGVLAYFDASVHAARCRVPTLVVAAKFDPAVPPPGQFAVFNALPRDTRQLLAVETGHFDPPPQGQDARVREEVGRWFASGSVA